MRQTLTVSESDPLMLGVLAPDLHNVTTFSTEKSMLFPCDLSNLLQAEFEFSKRSLETVEASHQVGSSDLRKRQKNDGLK